MYDAGTSQTSNSQGPNNASFKPSVFWIGANARYGLEIFCFRAELSAGPLLALMGLRYSSNSALVTALGDFSSLGLGAQAQASVGLKIYNGIVISPTAGYQIVSADGFHGTISGNGIPSVTGRLMMVPGPLGNGLTIVPDNHSAPVGSRPFKLDLSGLHYGAQVSLFF